MYNSILSPCNSPRRVEVGQNFPNSNTIQNFTEEQTHMKTVNRMKRSADTR